jgi:hypothetical protein
MLTGTVIIALTLIQESATDSRGMPLVANTIRATANQQGRRIDQVAGDRRIYSCWRFRSPEEALRLARGVKDAAGKKRLRDAWDLALKIQCKDYRAGAAQYYHDNRISPKRFQRMFQARLVQVAKTRHLTFYRAAHVRRPKP